MTEPGKGLSGAAIRGTVWSLVGRYSAKLVALLTVVVLARLLDKEAFGVAGYALLVIGIVDIIRDMGVGAALVYYRDEEEAPSTAFWLGLGMGLFLFALTWFLAPLVGMIFKDERAAEVTRVLGLSFPLTALGGVHVSVLYRNLQFKRKLVPDLMRAFGKAAVAIPLALYWKNHWSLVFGQLGAVVFAVVGFWIVCDFRPTLTFSKRLLRPLLAFGSKIVAVNLTSIVIRNLDHFFVGRYLGAASLGVYTLALRLPELIIMEVCIGIGQVVFPAFTQIKDDAGRLRAGFVQTVRFMALLTVPMAVGLGLVAEPLVRSVFGVKWDEAVPVMQALAVQFMLLSFSHNAGDVYKAQDRAGLLAVLVTLRGVVLLPALYWAATGPATVVAIVWTRTAVAALITLVELAIATRLLGSSFRTTFSAPLPALAAAAGMGGAVYGVVAATDGLAEPLRLAAGVLTGVVVYAASLRLFLPQIVEMATRKLRGALGKG